MGLAGVKKRSKLSHDPNNNNWSKSTTNFGHKILSKQGWKPGDYLGAENATHADHYTAANSSHIRVMLREDNLGLGAQVGKGNADTFGLALFSGVLGRLNGKSDAEVQKKQDALRDAELRAYQNTKYGFMNFVRGGLLVGDKMEPPKSTKIEDIKADGTVSENSLKRRAGDEKAEIKTKKTRSESGDRVKDEEEQERADLYAIPEKQRKRKGKKKAAEEDASTSASSEEDETKQEKRRKKGSKKADKAAKAETIATEEDQKARLKEEKRAMKEERRKRKEEKRAKRAAKQNAESAQQSAQTSAAPSENEGTSTPPMISVGGRHAVRHRYIMQKRMASMNVNSLKEIFMLQPQAAS